MPETIFFSCARTALIDQRTNSISLIEVFEDINATTLPLAVPQLSVVWVKRRSENDSDNMMFELDVNLGKNKLASFPVAVDYKASKTHRSIIILSGFMVTEIGTITLNVRAESKKIATYSVEVNLATNPSNVAAPQDVEIKLQNTSTSRSSKVKKPSSRRN